jgi:multicomponent Na+:H+ antiporter subunit B
MTSLILQTVSRVLIPIQIAFSLFLLLRGHNEPGGGFAGALVIAIALALHSVAFSPQATRKLLPVEPLMLVGLGLIAALLAGALGLVAGQAFLTGQWLDVGVVGVTFGTPLLFDIGVYLLVTGMTAAVLLRLMEDQ